jgi:hypothetical protein
MELSLLSGLLNTDMTPGFQLLYQPTRLFATTGHPGLRRIFGIQKLGKAALNPGHRG